LSSDLRRLSTLLEAGRRLNRSLELTRLLQEIKALIKEAFAVEAVTLLVWNDSRTQLEFRIAYDEIRVERDRPTLAPGLGIGGWIVRNDEPVLCNRTEEDPRFRHVMDREFEFETRNLLGIPLHRAGVVIGALELLNREDGDFTEGDLELLEALGEQVSIALDNALTYRSVRRERTMNEALFQVGLVLSRTVRLDDIIEILLDELQRVVPYDAAALYLKDLESGDLTWFQQRGYPDDTEREIQFKLGQGAVGVVAASGEPWIIPDISKEARYVLARKETCSEMVVPIVSESHVIGVLNLESDRLGNFGDADLKAALAFANQAGVSIDRALLSVERKKKQRLETEIHLARDIQRQFLPSSDPDLRRFDLAGTNIPSTEISGDAFDFIRIAEDQLGILIGDVSGKGLSAALILATLRASLRAEARHRYSIAEVLEKVNVLVHESVNPGQFATAVYGVLDEGRRRFTYANAGHDRPILIRADGRVERLEEGGLILGPYPDQPYRLGVVQIEPSEVLVLFTDGVTEAGAPANEMFGEDRLIEAIERARGKSSREVADAIVEAVRDYTGKVDQDDDITLVVLQLRDPELQVAEDSP